MVTNKITKPLFNPLCSSLNTLIPTIRIPPLGVRKALLKIIAFFGPCLVQIYMIDALIGDIGQLFPQSSELGLGGVVVGTTDKFDVNIVRVRYKLTLKSFAGQSFVHDIDITKFFMVEYPTKNQSYQRFNFTHSKISLIR